MLAPFTVEAATGGRVESILAVDLPVQHGQLVARLALPDDGARAGEGDDIDDEDGAAFVEVRAPVPGTVSDVLVAAGDDVESGALVARLAPSLEHLRNGILGLALVGTSEDAPLLRQIGDPRSGYPDEIRASARWAAEQVSAR